MRWILWVVVTSVSWTTYAKDTINKYGDLEVERLKNAGWFASLSEVSMVDELELTQKFSDILRNCKIEHQHTSHQHNRQQVNECVDEHFSQYLEMPLKDLRNWDKQRELLESDNESIDERLKVLETRFVQISEKQTLTEADVQQINQIMQQMSTLALEKANVTNRHTEDVSPYIENIINN
ncbi:hypothetical protein H2O73_14105 [Vibrio sp. 404]|uniref:Uncharacterized protein n=1 Tax=Vibrio marinisediminis TaxID=2758441 RepID=A0A7W2IUP3_9VIBR|nr:hypothetical protein [Vibrio marinisediminis]MBA5763493.1 hypothetical protein [Vibrio marinisediminis]